MIDDFKNYKENILLLKNVLDKINEIERSEYEISNIISIQFYTDGSGSIHSTDHEYFCFNSIKDLKFFMQMDFEYIIKYRKKYPIY